MTLKQPIVLHVELEDPTILQDLKRALKLMKGVGKISVKKKQDVRTLSKEEGEALVRNTLIPALQYVVVYECRNPLPCSICQISVRDDVTWLYTKIQLHS